MSLLSKTNTLIAQLESAVEERKQHLLLELEPSSNDDVDIINSLQKITKNLSYLDQDLHHKRFSELLAIVGRYNKVIDELDEDELNVEEYRYDLQVPEPAKEVKSVRFKDNDEDDDEDLRNELMGTKSFKPYRDEEDNVSLPETLDMDNHQMFAQHQQQLLSQDENLDALHESVRIQKLMGININQELEDHLILLNDLENGVDTADRRVRSTNDRLTEFRSRVQENGSLVTIIVLTVILIILLVVLN